MRMPDPSRALPAALLALLLLAAPHARAEDTATAPAETKAYAIGDTVKDFEAVTPGGGSFKLSDLQITKEKAVAAVRAAAEAFGGAADLPLATQLADLPGVKNEAGEVDADLMATLIGQVGMRFGLLAREDAVESLGTLADLVAWVEGAAHAPIVLNIWSPRCPMCKGGYDERVSALVAEMGARYVAVAGNYTDKEEHVTAYLDAQGWPWKVVLDPEQKVVDLFGAKHTPHLVVLDDKLVLRYSGGVDNDFREEKPEGERQTWLKDALEAVKTGGEVKVTTSEPAG